MAATLIGLVAAAAAEHRSRPALLDGDLTLSYGDLERRTLARAAGLRRAGASPGTRVALLLPNGLEFVVSYLAAAACGAAAVPLYDRFQEGEVLAHIDAAGARHLVTGRAFAAVAAAVRDRLGARCPVYGVEEEVSQETAPAGALAELARDVPAEAPLMVQFSSGTTGEPKRIARTQGQLALELLGLRAALGFAPDDRFLGAAPFSHVNGLVRTMLGSLASGAALCPLPRFGRHGAAEAIQRHRLTVFIGVPIMFDVLARGRLPADLSSLRLCVSASAPLPPAVSHEWKALAGRHVRQLYGSTETGSISANLDAEEELEASLVSVGRPLPGVEVEVRREDGSRATPGQSGEIAVRGASVVARYEDDAEGDAFRAGWFLSGDIGRQDADGRLFLEGRKKLLINRAGFKVNPREIEEVLERHPAVGEAIVLGVPTPLGDERVKAVVVPRGPCTEADLLEHCRGRIADFKVPSLIEFRPELPRSATGKVRRSLL